MQGIQCHMSIENAAETQCAEQLQLCLSAMLDSSMAFAQCNTNSDAGVAGKPGSKSGPAMTKSGPGSSNLNRVGVSSV
jgi:hypothetical protein